MRTEPIGFVRESATEPRILEGLAVPYGVISRPTELLPGSGDIVREAWAPGAFAEDVAQWNARPDGRRAPYRPRHDEKPVGVVTAWTETAEGPTFRASIFEGPRGDEYLAEVRAGLNGISVEGMWNDPPKRTRDGTVVHKTGRLHGIAGSDKPAYDGAYVAERDMESAMATDKDDKAEAQGEAKGEAVAVAERAEAKTVTPDLTSAARAEAENRTVAAIVPNRTPATLNRDALIYSRDGMILPNGRRPGFLSDGWLASQGDSGARERQYRYEQATQELAEQMERDAASAFRAGDVLSSELGGAFPNEYLPGLLVPRLIKGRPMGSFYDRFPISDGNPKIFPKVTTSTTVAVQSAEGVNPAASDFATAAVTVTPLIYGAETVVSRQALDGSNPAAEAMIMQDMLEAYAQASEAIIVTAVEAGSTASGTPITAATPYAGILGNIVKYASTRFSPAEGQFVPAALFAVLATQLSAGDGRPLIPAINPVNADGTLSGQLGYAMLGATGAMSYGSTVNVVVTARRSDFVIFESPIARFSYDAVTGPAGVRIGLWAYLGIGVRNVGGSLKVTAA
jgi:phage head maturation protease